MPAKPPTVTLVTEQLAPRYRPLMMSTCPAWLTVVGAVLVTSGTEYAMVALLTAPATVVMVTITPVPTPAGRKHWICDWPYAEFGHALPPTVTVPRSSKDEPEMVSSTPPAVGKVPAAVVI